MLNWPVLLKSVSLLGNSSQHGRIFGFFETGRGVVDTVVAFSALAVFAWFGSGYLGFKMGILFYSGVAILVGGIIFLFLKDDKHAVTEPVNESGENKEKKTWRQRGIKRRHCLSHWPVFTVF